MILPTLCMLIALAFFVLACVPKVRQPFSFVAAGLVFLDLGQFLAGWPFVR